MREGGREGEGGMEGGREGEGGKEGREGGRGGRIIYTCMYIYDTEWASIILAYTCLI